MTNPLHSTTDKVFDFIVTYKARHDGCSPTIREIMLGLSISSTSVVRYHLQQLSDQGKIDLIVRDADGNRSSKNIQVVGGQWSFQEAGND